MGCADPPLRISHSMDQLSPSSLGSPVHVPELCSRISEGPGCGSGNSHDAGEGHAGGSRSSVSGFLQPSLPGGEGDWRLEAGDRSLPVELIRPADQVQGGNHHLGDGGRQGGRLHGLSGSQGCIFSYTHPSRFSEVSLIY